MPFFWVCGLNSSQTCSYLFSHAQVGHAPESVNADPEYPSDIPFLPTNAPCCHTQTTHESWWGTRGGSRGKRGSLICRLQVSNDLILRTKQSLTGDFVDCWQCIECWANEITSHQNRSTESVHRNFDLNGHVKPIAPRQLELYLAWIYYKSPRISC
mgnify:CR=1 FL=1